MKRIVRLTESELTEIISKAINEQTQTGQIDYKALEMGSVELPKVIAAFYKKSVGVESSTGKKIITGVTYRPETANYTLKCFCSDGRTTINGTPVTVKTPNWDRFCK